jgi:16S rRNA (cytosine1402-N4)-methyltransferase
VRAKDIPPAQLKAVGKAVRASEAEVRRNPRSRSAVLRVAEKN